MMLMPDRALLIGLALIVATIGSEARPGSSAGHRLTMERTSATPRLVRFDSAVRPTCRSPSPTFPLGGDRRAPEIRGFAGRETLWALIFLPKRSAWADRSRAIFTRVRGEQVKIVWRVTGAQRVRFVARSPSGRTNTPRWGPEQHEDSTWTRPGHEWGTGFVFRENGCWRISVSGRRVQGVVTLVLR